MPLNVKIVFPPQFEPFQPYLAGPYLKGLLAMQNVHASFFDANIGFYDWLTATPANAWQVSDNEATSYLLRNIAEATCALKRNPTSLAEYRWATNVVDEYLHAISPKGIRVGLTYLKVGNRFSSEDLRKYLDDADNLFSRYFEHDAEHILAEPAVSVYLLTLVVIDQLAAAIAFAREIRRRRKGARVLIGGPLVSRLHRQLSAIPWIADTFDAIVPGEAYRTLPPLLGLTKAYSGHISPDFSDCELDRYWSCQKVLPYLVAHGCKWGKCTFCSHHMTYDGYRTSAIADVIADIEQLIRKHDVSCISFCDEYLTPEQLRSISTGFQKRNIAVSWSTFARPEPAFRNQEFLHQLYDAGCRMLMFGLESGSQHIIKSMKKGTRVDNFRPILEGCKAANIAIRYDFMVGFPGETEEDVQETYRFIRENLDVVDTPFSSYSVAAFELREGIPVQQAAEQYGIRPRQLLRGDLDDQYEFESDHGLNEKTRAKWRDALIRLSKTEMNAEIICPHNKTHQLVLKHLYDEQVLDLPVLKIESSSFSGLWAQTAKGVEIYVDEGGVTIRNAANGGRLALSSDLQRIVDCFRNGTYLEDAFRAQDIWNRQTFSDFITFLYRNEYIAIDNPADKIRSRSNAPLEASYA